MRKEKRQTLKCIFLANNLETRYNLHSIGHIHRLGQRAFHSVNTLYTRVAWPTAHVAILTAHGLGNSLGLGFSENWKLFAKWRENDTVIIFEKLYTQIDH